jgi:hypothetical protein
MDDFRLPIVDIPIADLQSAIGNEKLGHWLSQNTYNTFNMRELWDLAKLFSPAESPVLEFACPLSDRHRRPHIRTLNTACGCWRRIGASRPSPCPPWHSALALTRRSSAWTSLTVVVLVPGTGSKWDGVSVFNMLPRFT